MVIIQGIVSPKYSVRKKNKIMLAKNAIKNNIVR